MERKHANDQEKNKKTRSRPRYRPRKRKQSKIALEDVQIAEAVRYLIKSKEVPDIKCF